MIINHLSHILYITKVIYFQNVIDYFDGSISNLLYQFIRHLHNIIFQL